MLTKRTRSDGLKGSRQPMADMTSTPQPRMPETLPPGLVQSAQQGPQVPQGPYEPPKHPFSEAQIKAALGYDPDDPNVTVEIRRADKLGGDDPLRALFDMLLGHDGKSSLDVTGAVTGARSAEFRHGEDDVKVDEWADVSSILAEVRTEVMRAVAIHGPMHSPHEGYAVLKEEVDELWDAIKHNNAYGYDARKEAIQVAAMAVRYLLDVDPD